MPFLLQMYRPLSILDVVTLGCHRTFNLHIFLNKKEVLQRRGVWARARGFYRILKSKSLVPSEKGRNRDRISWSLERSFRGKTLRETCEINVVNLLFCCEIIYEEK